MLADCDNSDGGHERLLITLTELHIIRIEFMLTKLRKISIEFDDYDKDATNQKKLLDHHVRFKKAEEDGEWFNYAMELGLSKIRKRWKPEKNNSPVINLEQEHEYDMNLIDQYFRYAIDWKVTDQESFRHIFEEPEKFKSAIENLDEAEQIKLVEQFEQTLFSV